MRVDGRSVPAGLAFVLAFVLAGPALHSQEPPAEKAAAPPTFRTDIGVVDDCYRPTQPPQRRQFQLLQYGVTHGVISCA